MVKVKKFDENPVSVDIRSESPISFSVNKAFIETLINLAESWKKMDINKELSDRQSFKPFWVLNETGREIKYWITGSKDKNTLKPYQKEEPIIFPSSLDYLFAQSVNYEKVLTMMSNYTINFQVEGINSPINKLPLNRIEKFLIPSSQNNTLVYEIFLKNGSKICALRSPIIIKNQSIYIYIFLFSITNK